MKKADYGKIASFYDKARSLSDRNVDLWLEMVATHLKGTEEPKVLDLGCGTGRFALPMAEGFRFHVTGADASAEMLEKAIEKDTGRLVKWDRQDAEHLTYPYCSFDACFMSHLLHHVDSPLQVVKECARVLNDSGAIFVRYGSLEQIRDDVEHTFFPEAFAIDEARAFSVNVVEEWLTTAGFSGIESDEIVQKTFESGVAALEAVKRKNISVLTMIPEEAFSRGVQRLAEYVARNPNDPWLLFDSMTLTVGHKRHAGQQRRDINETG